MFLGNKCAALFSVIYLCFSLLIKSGLKCNKLKKIAKAPASWIFCRSFLASILTRNTFFEKFCGKMKSKSKLFSSAPFYFLKNTMLLFSSQTFNQKDYGEGQIN